MEKNNGRKYTLLNFEWEAKSVDVLADGSMNPFWKILHETNLVSSKEEKIVAKTTSYSWQLRYRKLAHFFNWMFIIIFGNRNIRFAQ